MNNPAGPWSLVRHMWARNFQQNPIGTVVGSLLAAGGVGLMLFFGFFILVAMLVIGGVFVLAQTLLGAPRSGPAWSGSPTNNSSDKTPKKNYTNNELEGEFTVLPEEKSDRT